MLEKEMSQVQIQYKDAEQKLRLGLAEFGCDDGLYD